MIILNYYKILIKFSKNKRIVKYNIFKINTNMNMLFKFIIFKLFIRQKFYINKKLKFSSTVIY